MLKIEYIEYNKYFVIPLRSVRNLVYFTFHFPIKEGLIRHAVYLVNHLLLRSEKR